MNKWIFILCLLSFSMAKIAHAIQDGSPEAREIDQENCRNNPICTAYTTIFKVIQHFPTITPGFKGATSSKGANSGARSQGAAKNSSRGGNRSARPPSTSPNASTRSGTSRNAVIGPNMQRVLQSLKQDPRFANLDLIKWLQSKNFKIPKYVYRAHDGTRLRLVERPGTSSNQSGLAEAIKQTSRTSGSAHIFSLSARAFIASHFMKSGRVLLKIETFGVDGAPDPNFKTVADIILTDGEELMASGQIKPGTMLKAIRHLAEGENEVFYTAGDIPDEYIVNLRLTDSRLYAELPFDESPAIATPSHPDFEEYAGQINGFTIHNLAVTDIRASYIETPDGQQYKPVKWTNTGRRSHTGQLWYAGQPSDFERMSLGNKGYISLKDVRHVKTGRPLPEGSYVRLVVRSNSTSDPKIGEYFSYEENGYMAQYSFTGSVFGVAARYHGNASASHNLSWTTLAQPQPVGVNSFFSKTPRQFRRRRDLLGQSH